MKDRPDREERPEPPAEKHEGRDRRPPLGVLIVALAIAAALAAGVIWSAQIRSLAGRAHEAIFGKPEATQAETGKVTYYTCGMHPWIMLPKPGDCPICHMTLVPMKPPEEGSAANTSEFGITPIMTQNIGVRIAPAVQGPVTRVIRTVGTVDYDERRVRDVTLKVEGWVQKLYVNETGQAVKADEPLLDIYSPQLYSAQEEYLIALRRYQASADKGADAPLLESSRKRLEYLDVPPDQIKELERTGKPAKTMTLRSPFEGLVVVKEVFEGMKVDGNMLLFRIADLSKVWIMATIYEYQAPYVEVGQHATVSLPYVPGQTFDGTVAYVYPYLNVELRQLKVRIELDNPSLLLKPGMYASVELRRTLAVDRVLVPREAVTDTGTRQVAFVSLGEGRFQVRNVKVGVEAEDGMIEILDGIKPGEMIVVSSEFLLDSEARLREAQRKMAEGQLAAGQKAPGVPAGASELSALPAGAAAALGDLLDSYFAIGSALANDTANGLADPARKIAQDTDALLKTEIPDAPHFWHQHTELADIRGRALELADAKDIEPARQKFADLGVALIKLIRATGIPPAYGKPVEALHCPMYREGQGGTYWLQPAGDVRNPYYGKAMIGCFDSRETLPVTGARPAPVTAPTPAPPPAPPTQMPPGHRHGG